MVTALEIKNLVQTEEYENLLDVAQNEYQIDIYDEDTLIQECNAVADEINKSGLLIEFLFKFIFENSQLILKFSKHKISDLSSNYCDFGEDDEDDEVIFLGQSKTFLISNAIEVALIERTESDLINFLRAIKVPSFKKYAKELIEFYEKSKQ